MTRPFVLAQISDLHVTDGPPPNGADTAESLKRVLAAMEAFAPDAILATGDLVQEGRAAEYAILRRALTPAPAPLVLMPGNHDEVDAMRAAFPDQAHFPARGALSFSIDSWPLRLVALDSTVAGLVEGVFPEDRAAWLDATLGAAPEAPTLLALHHPPFTVYDHGFDRIGLTDRERFAEIVARHPQVRLIVAGHYHRAAFGRVGATPAMTCPSSGWHYAYAPREGMSHFPTTREPPGFLLHSWTPERGLSSQAFWVPS